MTQRIKVFYCNEMKNELRSCHNKTIWVNFVWMQDFWVFLRMDSISWRKTLQISHNLIQWPVVNTLFQEKTKYNIRKDGSKETPKLDSCRSCNQLFARWIWSWDQNLVYEQRQYSLLGQNLSWLKQISHDFEQQWAGNLRNPVRRIWLKLSASDFASRSKAKSKPQRRDSASSSTRTILVGERTWTDIERQNIRSPIIQCRRNSSIFFVMEVHFETMMERLNSGERKIIFRIILCFVIIGLTKSGRAAWQEEEDTRKDFSIVLIFQE